MADIICEQFLRGREYFSQGEGGAGKYKQWGGRLFMRGEKGREVRRDEGQAGGGANLSQVEGEVETFSLTY